MTFASYQNIDMTFLHVRYGFAACVHLTSSDFSVKADNYDFANNPPSETCSSDERLDSVKSQRKSQAFFCTFGPAYVACNYYRSKIELLARTEVANNTIDLIKIKAKSPLDVFVDIYVICNPFKGEIYSDFYPLADEKDNMKIYTDFISQLNFVNIQSIVLDVSTLPESSKSEKVSYLSKLVSS